MFNRLAVLLVGLGIVAGYGAGGMGTSAQGDALPFGVGDTVTLWYVKHGESPTAGSSVPCVVGDIRGTFVRCGERSRIGGSNRSERWFSLKYVSAIEKREE